MRSQKTLTNPEWLQDKYVDSQFVGWLVGWLVGSFLRSGADGRRGPEVRTPPPEVSSGVHKKRKNSVRILFHTGDRDGG